VFDSVLSNCILENYYNGSTEDGIDFSQSGNITVDNIIIKGFYDAIKIIDTDYISLSNIVMTKIGYHGFKLQGKHININNFNINDTVYIAISMDSSSSFVSISNGNIYDSKSVGIQISANDNVSISNVKIHKTQDSGIRIGSNDVTINNLHVFEAGNENYMGGAENIHISNSIFKDSPDYGLAIINCHYFTIDHCDFISNNDGIDTTIGAVNSNYSITNCRFEDNAKAIDIGGDHNLTIMNCFFRDNSDDGIECDALGGVIIIGCNMYGDPFDDNIVGSKVVSEDYNIGMNTI